MTEEAKKVWNLGTPGHTKPLSIEELEEMARDGRLRATDLVKREGESWRAACEVLELSSYFPGHEKPPEPPKRQSRFDRRGAVRAAAEEKAAREKAAKEKTAKEKDTKGTDVKKTAPKEKATKKKPAKEKAAAKEKKVEPVEPMPKRDLAPQELVKLATLAFEPRRLFVTLILAVPFSVVVAVLLGLRGALENAALKAIFFVPALVVTAVASGAIFTVLAFLSRRQIEGKPCSLGAAIEALKNNLVTALLSMVLPLVPSVVALGILFALGLFRNSGQAPAMLLRIGYIVPMVVSLVAVGGLFIYQLAAMYVPSAAAVEGAGLKASIRRAWLLIRRRPGRVISHWIVVTVIVGVVAGLFLTLSFGAFFLPELVFPTPDLDVAKAWASAGMLVAIYGGVAFGLAMVLPVSLLGMLGMLSYLMLREDAEPDAPEKEEEAEEKKEEEPAEKMPEATFEVPPEEEPTPPELEKTDLNEPVEDNKGGE